MTNPLIALAATDPQLAEAIMGPQDFKEMARIGMEEYKATASRATSEGGALAVGDGAAIRSQLEIESLKQEWYRDPVWDIEDTEGFEAHKAELLAFHNECREEWNQARERRVTNKSRDLGCSETLAEYILGLEFSIQRMSDRITSLENAR